MTPLHRGVTGEGSLQLDQLEPMRCAMVLRVQGVDDTDSSAAQLMAMGVCAGRKIEVVKRGDPLILRVLGSRIGVSARLAQRVIVQTCTDLTCVDPY